MQNPSNSEPSGPANIAKPQQKTKAGSTTKRLAIACLICFIFMLGEIIGGIIADSIAVLSDAAHMLTDLVGLIVSLIFTWLSQRPAKGQYTYGFHRAGVIGALFNMVILWVITGVLVYLAVLRINEPEHVDGKVMFITAMSGLIVNLVMIKVLHGDHSHGGHDHSHGHSHGHSHDHAGHAHEHSHGKHTHSSRGLLNFWRKQKKETECTATTTHSHHDHDHHAHPCSDHKHSEPHPQPQVHQSPEQQEIPHQNPTQDLTSGAVSIKVEDPKDKASHSHSHSHTHAQKKHDENIRAAILHVLGDTLQSVGVVIASILIWIWPDDLNIADPICTFIFSAIILLTSKSIIIDCVNVLMEKTPKDYDLIAIHDKFMAIPEVFEVHDLHIWSLNANKVSLSVHLRTKNYRQDILELATNMSRSLGITHSTIQVETVTEENSVATVACDQDIH